jgi:cardiolipin synthase A/B
MPATVEALSSDLARAERRVWIETYICRDDEGGRALEACLLDAVARGVQVRLLYDPLGSRGADPSFFAALAARGVEVSAYRPQRFALRGRHLGVRDHSRAALIDEVAYTGGANVGREWLPRSRGGDEWHDVCVRFEGPCVEDVARTFELRWSEARGRLRPRDLATGARHSDVEWVSAVPGRPALILERYRDRIRRARERVWIENSYFLPPPALLRDLFAAAARGVDVTLILPRHTDLPLVRRAARVEYLASSMRAGSSAACASTSTSPPPCTPSTP